MSFQIYVGNLAYKMTEDSLRELFEQHGEVTSVKIIKDRFSGRSKAFGFIEMADKQGAETPSRSLTALKSRGEILELTKRNQEESSF